MRKFMTTGAALAAVALTAATIAVAGPRQAVPLKGTVGPGFTITLTKGGKKVTTLEAGTYTFVIADKSSVHNFELEREGGRRFEKELTDVSQLGTKTVRVKLTPGRWRYFCDPHESTMFGVFVVR